MRSRNGNRALLLAICTIIFLPLQGADEYIISYRSVVKDAILINETLNVSRAMRPCRGMPSTSILLETGGSADLHKIISVNFEDFFPFIQKEKLHILHREKNTNALNSSKSVLTLPPQCFTVDFNEDFVRISTLK